jgi:hypothetical protein
MRQWRTPCARQGRESEIGWKDEMNVQSIQVLGYVEAEDLNALLKEEK